MTSKPVRAGFGTITPYLIVPDLAEGIKFIQEAFDGVETQRTTGAAGGTHVEMRVGDSMLMIAGTVEGVEPIPAMLYLYLHDVDAVYQHALAAGATAVMEPADQPDGERRAGVQDPSGNLWYIGAPIG